MANLVGTQQRNIENANRATNPMEFMELKYTSPKGEQFTFFCRAKKDVDSKTLKWIYKLAERNVSVFYKELEMGWQPKVKQNYLNKNWARYMVAFDKNKSPVGYIMFRFDQDYGFSVAYCYEVQIEPLFHRQGLGKFMLTSLENCAKYWKMEKVVLTVLKNNTNSMMFFKALGYNIDETSPGVLEKAEYDILSKRLDN